MKKCFFISLLLINYSCSMNSSSWFEKFKNAFSFSSAQPSQEQQVQQQQQSPLTNLTSDKALIFDLMHLNSLEIPDQIAKLQLDLRHLQSLKLDDQIRVLQQQKEKITAKLFELQELAKQEDYIRNELSRLSKLAMRQEEIKRKLGRSNLN